MFETAAISNRFELKYVLTERQAVAVREYVWHHVEPDEHSPSDCTAGYSVSSLYLESPARDIYRQAVTGASRRYKLRLRFYDNGPNSPVFAEIKRRVNHVVVKDRAVVSHQTALALAGSYAGWPIETIGTTPAEHTEHEASLSEFVRLRDQIGAVGLVFVSYTREAYVSRHGEYARVTFDRDVHGSLYQRGDSLRFPEGGVQPLQGKVVLELKFTDRCPSWMLELVRHFDLERISVAKYVLCLQAAGLAPG